MSQIWTNISTYRFVDMPDYEEMRNPLRQFCNRLGIKGTILLSHEGINIFLSAPRDNIDAFLEHLQSDERFANLTVKYSESESCAFRRMNVRLKNEVGVNSTDYWKNTHNAMKKISERLVKLANKVGQLY